jgi:hypothetical protein
MAGVMACKTGDKTTTEAAAITMVVASRMAWSEAFW